MSYFVVEDFRIGLDRRKHILTLPPGALFDAKNVNISRGGELEAAKAFVPRFTLPAGTFGCLSAAGKLYAFGSIAAPAMPSGVLYQRLQYPDGSAMTELVHATTVKGKIYAIARFVGGLGVFYNGTIIADWLPTGTGIASYSDVAANFAAAINANPNYSASASGAMVTITGRNSTPFSVAATAINGGAVNNQLATTSTIQASGGVVAEVPATGSVTFSGVDNSQNSLNYLTINGIFIVSSPFVSDDDFAAAAFCASLINSSGTGYSAVANGAVVTITAPAGRGASENDSVVQIDTPFGGVTTTNMAGGVSASLGAPQISTVSFSGTFEAADTYSVTLQGEVFLIAGVGAAGQLATFALTKNSKTYVIAGPNLFGSAIGDATKYNSGTGAFVTDMSNEVTGAETLTALALFQGNLAVFARSVIQIWAVDPDPANNQQLQVLQNIGTLAPKSVDAFGDSDVFFLSDTGLRSLKVRINSNNATLSDIGSPVDPIIIAAIKAAGADAAKAVSAIEPIDGRFLLQIGTTTYVFNYFPGAKVSGWTTYETGMAFTDFAVLEQRLYARAGDTIYLLGGLENDTYSTPVFDVTLPFLSARQIATVKHFTGIDVVCEGEFDVYMATDPDDVAASELVVTINKPTIGLGNVPIDGQAEVVSLRFVGRAGQSCKIASALVHYEPMEAA